MKTKGNWSGTAQNRIWLIAIQFSVENNRKLVWDSPGQNLIDFYLNFNWKLKEIGLRQPRTESKWFLFKFWLKIKEIGLGQPRTESDWFLFKFQTEIKGNWSGTAQDRIWLIFHLNFNWKWKEMVWDSPRQNLIDFYLNFNWKLKEIDLGQPKTESDWFLFKFPVKIKGNWSGMAQDRI